MILDFSREKRSLEEVQASDTRKGLRNAQERVFASAVIESFDPTFAAMTAYEMTNQENARKSSFGLLKRTQIRAVLDYWLKKSPQEKLDDDIQRELRSRRKEPLAARLRALQMRAQLVGLRMEIPRDDKSADSKAASVPQATALTEKKRHKIGDLIDYGHQKVRVTRIDEDGQAVEGDPVEVNS